MVNLIRNCQQWSKHGGASVQRATIKRLFPDGRLDAAFQDRLKAACLQQLIPQTDDKLLVLHRTCGLGASDRTYLARLNNDGSVDSTFDATAVEARYLERAEVLFAGVRRGFRYALEASTDLRTWMKVEELGPIQFDPAPEFTVGFFDADAGRFRQRFYNVVETAP